MQPTDNKPFQRCPANPVRTTPPMTDDSKEPAQTQPRPPHPETSQLPHSTHMHVPLAVINGPRKENAAVGAEAGVACSQSDCRGRGRAALLCAACPHPAASSRGRAKR